MLTEAKIQGLENPGRYTDGRGLALVVARGGSKHWTQRIRWSGARREVGLGGWPTVSLESARAMSAVNSDRVKRGEKPLPGKSLVRHMKRALTAVSSPRASYDHTTAPVAPVPTFEECARAFHTENSQGRWSNTKNRKSWIQRAENHIFPRIGLIPVNRVTQADVLGVLIPHWLERQETSKRLRIIMKQTFKRALAYGYIETNPAGEAIDGGLPARKRTVNHLKALHYSEVAEALAVADAGPSNPVTKLALRFQVLTAARPGEVRHATYSEIDFDKKVWTVSAEKAKARRPHRVPLSTGALAVLVEAAQLPKSSVDLVFPSHVDPDKPLSDAAVTLMLRKRIIESTAHGFRSSFRDWSAEKTKYSWAACEAALAHTQGSVVAAYHRTDLLEERRGLMQSWSDYLENGVNHP